jgi:threonine dehydratase
MDIPTAADVEEARRAIAGAALRTPLVRLESVEAGPAVYLKLENLQPIGSFKIRGATNAVARLPPDRLARGLLTASAGNMAQGCAWAARRAGVSCTVIAPDTAPRAKVAAVERLGGRVVKVPFDEWWRTFEERAYPGIDGAFVHAFDDLHVMAGNGTIAWEILEDLPEVDAIVVPWGGGGLACGIAAAARARRAACRVYAAEVETAAPLGPSLAARRALTVEYRPSFVDGIGARTVFPVMLERAQVLLDGVVKASLDEVAAAVRLLAERQRVIAEGAGACALACALSGRVPGRTVVCIVSGGNIDADKLSTILAGRVPSVA